MILRNYREFYVQPKTFQSVGFHHQGIYSIKIKLVQVDHKLKKVYGHPTLIYTSNNPLSRSIKQGSKVGFDSEHFQVSYNDQTINLADGCLFTIEDQLSKITSTYLQFQLFKLIDKKDTSQPFQANQVVSTAKLFINLNVNDDNTTSSSYQKVLFNSSEYYSSLYIFVEHVKLWTKLRLNSYQLSQFSQNKVQTHRKSNQKNVDILQPFSQLSTFEVYQLLIVNAITQYKKICSLHHKLVTIVSMFSKSVSPNEIIMPKNLDYILTDNRNLMKHYHAEKYQQLYKILYQESYDIGVNIKYVWKNCIELVHKMRPKVLMKNVIQSQEVYNKANSSYFEISNETSSGKKWSQLVKFHQNKLKNAQQHYRFYFQSVKNHPMILQEKIINFTNNNMIQHFNLSTLEILTVFVHGYKGNQHDMSKMKCHLFNYFNSNFLILKSIETCMDQSIEKLASNASIEIKQFLEKKPSIKRINFIGFSLGGVIIRALIPLIQQYKPKINLLITIATPHLGISQIQSCVIKTGMKCMTKISNIENIKQLALEKEYLFKIDCQSLNWFKNIILVGSDDDQYVPSYSSLLNYQGDNQIIRNIQNKMLKNIRQLHKLNIWFKKEQNFMDMITKRKGHIAYLQSDSFLQYLFGKYWKLF